MHVTPDTFVDYFQYSNQEVTKVHHSLSSHVSNKAMVIFIHGLGSSPEKSPLISNLSWKLSRAGVSSVAPFLPCHMDYENDSSRFTLGLAIQSVIELIDHIFEHSDDIDQIHLVGSSLGGYIAQVLLQIVPDKVRSATVISSVYNPTILIEEILRSNNVSIQEWKEAGTTTLSIPGIWPREYTYDFYQELLDGDVHLRLPEGENVRALHGSQDTIVPTRHALRHFWKHLPQLCIEKAGHEFSTTRQVTMSTKFMFDHVIRQIDQEKGLQVGT